MIDPESDLDPGRRLQRAPDLDIRALPDGYVVYQAARDRIHYLNATAALLLELCDGTPSLDELPGLAASACGVAAVPTEEIAECLRHLLAEGLLA
jgi:hypothetical protein